MSYESPIKLFQTDPLVEQLRDETDNMIYRAVIHADVNVDREELIRALEYDRGQYEKGYADGLAYKPPIQTNADRIRAMTDEELANFLDRVEMGDIDYSKTFCDLCDGFYDCRDDCLVGWLKQEVDDGT